MINRLARWVAAARLGEPPLDPLAAAEDERRPRRSRWADPLAPSRAGRTRFSQEIDRWLALNHWTASLFAALTQQCREPALVLSAGEVDAILSGSRLELMPRHFRAFAAVERLTRVPRPVQPQSDQDLIVCFASSICVDDAALQPSWWFAVYCGEDWALQKLREPAPAPVQELAALRRSLPPLLRTAMAGKGLDPVSQLRSCAQRLPRPSALQSQRFVDWILDYDRLDERELRLAIAFALLLMAELGLEYRTLFDVPPLAAVPAEAANPRRRPTLLRA